MVGAFFINNSQIYIFMSYFPLLNVPNLEGWVGLSNFSPNNWEHFSGRSQFFNVTWSEKNTWKSLNLGKLVSGEFRTVTSSEISKIVPEGSLGLISLTFKLLPKISDFLPKLCTLQTSVPVWRATIGLSNSNAQTSYQGELDAFPSEGTLLTFGPFLQFGEGINNQLILLNLENSPTPRFAELEIYEAEMLSLKGTFTIRNNASNFIQLDDLGFGKNDLPIIICRSMSAIPLFLSSSMDGHYLSLEHSHPPASLVVQGRRWEAQKLLKKRWFDRSNDNCKKA